MTQKERDTLKEREVRALEKIAAATSPRTGLSLFAKWWNAPLGTRLEDCR